MSDLGMLRQEAITKGWEAYHEADPYSVSEVEAAMVATFKAGVAAGREAAAAPLAEFSVGASMDGEMTLDHDVQPGSDEPWCWWATAIDNGTTVPELVELARTHLADQHGHASPPPS